MGTPRATPTRGGGTDCPGCGSLAATVLRTQKHKTRRGVVLRTRRCLDCGLHYVTDEQSRKTAAIDIASLRQSAALPGAPPPVPVIVRKGRSRR